MGITVIDILVVGLYMTGMIIFGLIAAGRQRTAADYFLGGRRIPWWAVLLSVVATETSTLTFISIPAVAYGGNLTFLQITIGYILGRTAVSLILLPRYVHGRMSTAYEFIGRRFGRGMQTLASSTFMVTRLLADGVRLFASAIPLALILNLAGFPATNLLIYLVAILLIAAVTLLYTYLGGIRAVVWMDVIQLTVYIGGACLAVGLIFSKLPGEFGNVFRFAQESGKLQLFYLGFDLHWKDFLASPYTLLTAIFGGAVFSFASHGTDQLIVQRLLSTRTLRSAQKALIGSGLVVGLQFSLFMLVGLLLYRFYNGLSASQLGLNTPDEIFAKFIVDQVPAGLSGLILAAIMAAAMSTLSSSINSLASSTMIDVYRPRRKKSVTEGKDLLISRLFTLGWGIILIGSAFGVAVLQLTSPSQRPAVVELGLGIASYTYGGLLGIFLLGTLSKKAGGRQAALGFMAGLLALLFLVEGPVQDLLPGKGLTIAWPLYTAIGSAVVLVIGWTASQFRKK